MSIQTMDPSSSNDPVLLDPFNPKQFVRLFANANHAIYAHHDMQYLSLHAAALNLFRPPISKTDQRLYNQWH